jgi:hypothetical protein
MESELSDLDESMGSLMSKTKPRSDFLSALASKKKESCAIRSRVMMVGR